MFFDPVLVRRGQGGRRRAVACRVPLRFVCIAGLLLPLFEPTAAGVRWATEQAGGNGWPEWVPAVGGVAAVVLASVAISFARGWLFVLAGGLIAAGGCVFAAGPHAGRELAAAVAACGGLLPGDIAVGGGRSLPVVVAAGWVGLGGWWAFGKATGFGGRFGLPEFTWADPLLGNPCRPALRPNRVVGYVVYRDWNVYQELTAADLSPAFTLTVWRRMVAKRALVEKDGELTDGGWVYLAGGRVGVFALLPNLRFRRADAGLPPAHSVLSLIDPAADGCRAVPVGPLRSPAYRTLHLPGDARRRTPPPGRPARPPDPEPDTAPGCSVPAPVPSARGPGRLVVRQRGGLVVLAAADRGGFRFTPLARRRLDQLSDEFLAFVRPGGAVGRVVIAEPLGSTTFETVLTGLGEFVRRSAGWQPRVGASEPKHLLPLLLRWATHLCRPPGELAFAYLNWAADPQAMLPDTLVYDPYSGAVASTYHRLIDLGPALVVLTEGVSVELVHLPVPPATEVNRFLHCLAQVDRLKRLGV